jgi:putative oxygen-independent coproporphyrinogen III oxidase
VASEIQKNIPLSLYIHIPWCIRKCPYCDFNSHAKSGDLPEAEYVAALLADLTHDLSLIHPQTLQSIFIGGGTPSLFSGATIAQLLKGIQQHIPFSSNCEITLEANPGAIDTAQFTQFYEAGVNRLSLGVQSFQDEKLQALGRIHSSGEAVAAIKRAREAGFSNINIDLMHGLPNQTLKDALSDLQQALDLEPTHLSWYQLTLEPNTPFYKTPPPLPSDPVLAEIEAQGLALLAAHEFKRYEISAYAHGPHQSQHNLNYWHFGDYLGIGAGAHSKLHLKNNETVRLRKVRMPKDYLQPKRTVVAEQISVSPDDLVFEFVLNTFRLFQPIPFALFEQRTGLPREHLTPGLNAAAAAEFITPHPDAIHITPLGHRFLNDLTSLFL